MNRIGQQERLARFGELVRWVDQLPAQMQGVVVGNEVLDAMPVQLLARIGHVDDALRIVLVDARTDTGEVGSRVVVAAVRFADDRDAELLLLEVDDERALGLDGEPHLLKLRDDVGHHVVVVRFAAVGVELDAELLVHAVELADRNVDELLP